VIKKLCKRVKVKRGNKICLSCWRNWWCVDLFNWFSFGSVNGKVEWFTCCTSFTSRFLFQSFVAWASTFLEVFNWRIQRNVICSRMVLGWCLWVFWSELWIAQSFDYSPVTWLFIWFKVGGGKTWSWVFAHAKWKLSTPGNGYFMTNIWVPLSYWELLLLCKLCLCWTKSKYRFFWVEP